MSTPPIKISKEAIVHILQVHAEQGSKAAEALAPLYGVSAHYAKQLAWTHGVRVKKPRGGPRIATHNDPRWKVAVERGHVIA